MKKKNVTLTTLSAALSFACSQADFQMIDDGHFNAAGIHVTAVTQDLKVTSDAQVDILFVVDNSGSMTEEQTNFSAKIDGFMALIKDLDWHIALTTTDPNALTKAPNGVQRNWGDGQFRPFDADDGSLYVLKAGEVSLADAQAKLASAIQVGLSGSGDERAVNASYRAIERIADTGANAGFFRAGARLAVVAISDENECSNGKCLSSSPKSVPENLVSLVQSTWGAGKVFMFNSIARMSGDSACTTATVADVYETASRITSGVTGSVCASDYTSILSKLGTRVVELIDSVQLSCAPEDMTGDGVGDVSVTTQSGAAVSTPFKLEGKLLTFSSPLDAGSYRVSYHCL